MPINSVDHTRKNTSLFKIFIIFYRFPHWRNQVFNIVWLLFHRSQDMHIIYSVFLSIYLWTGILKNSFTDLDATLGMFHGHEPWTSSLDFADTEENKI